MPVLPEIALSQGTSVTMGYVMIPWISVFSSPGPMAPPAMMDSTVPSPISVRAGYVRVRFPGIVPG